MRTFFAVILILLAVLTGGCSLMFFPMISAAGGGNILPIWSVGVAITVICIFAAISLLRKR